MTNVYDTAPIDSETMNKELEEICNSVSIKGGILVGVDDDLIEITCSSKQSFYDICDMLDESSIIDEYDVTLWHKTDGITQKVSHETIDISTLDNFVNIKIDIVAFIKSELVDYTYYNDVEDSDLNEKVETPIWVKINKKSNLSSGKFVIEPLDDKSIAVYVKYKVSELNSDLNNINKIIFDVNTINNGEIHNQLCELGYICQQNIDYDVSRDLADYGNEINYTTAPAIYTLDEGVNITDILESFDNSTLYGEIGLINEAERVLKVNFKGIKRIKIKCQRGYKYDENRKACVKISGRELATMRRAKIKMVRTKRAKGSSFQRAVTRKTNKALRFRKLMGK